LGVAIVEKQVLDDRREIGAEGAALAELAEDAVVVLDALQTDVRGKLLAVGVGQPVPVRDERDHAVQQRQVREKLLLRRHGARFGSINCLGMAIGGGSRGPLYGSDDQTISMASP
jgi:hypothetical protein